MPLQQTSVNSRSVLAGKAARLVSLILGQELILKDSRAGWRPSTCTRSLSVIRDLHRAGSQSHVAGPCQGQQGTSATGLKEISVLHQHSRSAAKWSSKACMTQRLSAPLMQVSALQHSQRSLYVISSGINFKACRSRHTSHSYEDGRTATLHSQQEISNKESEQIDQSLLVLPAADLQLAQVTEGQQTICLCSISASCTMQSVYHAAVLPQR